MATYDWKNSPFDDEEFDDFHDSEEEHADLGLRLDSYEEDDDDDEESEVEIVPASSESIELSGAILRRISPGAEPALNLKPVGREPSRKTAIKPAAKTTAPRKAAVPKGAKTVEKKVVAKKPIRKSGKIPAKKIPPELAENGKSGKKRPVRKSARKR